MVDYFMGKVVPTGLVKEDIDYAKLNWSLCAKASSTRCRGPARGADCICDPKNRHELEKLLEYWGKKKVCPRFPISRGMVAICTHSQTFINSDHAVKLRSWLLVMEVYVETGMISGIELFIDRDGVSGNYFLKLGKSRNVRHEEIEAAYRYSGGIPSGEALETLLKHLPDAADSWTPVYQRNADEPLEITVDELEKQLGRKVKIVGKEK